MQSATWQTQHSFPRVGPGISDGENYFKMNVQAQTELEIFCILYFDPDFLMFRARQT